MQRKFVFLKAGQRKADMSEKQTIGLTDKQARAVLERAIKRNKLPRRKSKDGPVSVEDDLPIVPFDVQIANEIRIHEQKLEQDKEKTPKAPHNT